MPNEWDHSIPSRSSRRDHAGSWSSIQNFPRENIWVRIYFLNGQVKIPQSSECQDGWASRHGFWYRIPQCQVDVNHSNPTGNALRSVSTANCWNEATKIYCSAYLGIPVSLSQRRVFCLSGCFWPRESGKLFRRHCHKFFEECALRIGSHQKMRSKKIRQGIPSKWVYSYQNLPPCRTNQWHKHPRRDSK